VNLGKENEQQEFKPGLAQLDKGLKSLSAMLNRQQKGTVYFGVDDDGTVEGIEIGKKTLLDIRSRAAEMIEPRIILNIDDLKDENGLTYIRVFAEGSDIPYSCDGRYYIRTASADEQIGSDLLRKMLISGNTDMLMQITSENQDLSFDGLMSYFSFIRVKCDKEKCISCGKCKRVCPMNVDVTDNSRKRENGTECILCMECVKNCPKGAL